MNAPCSGLRSQLQRLEVALEEERRAHISSRHAAAARESELQAALEDSTSELVTAQQRAQQSIARVQGTCAAQCEEHPGRHWLCSTATAWSAAVFQEFQ